MFKLNHPIIKATIIANTLALSTLSLNAQASTLQIANGILMGANGVTVNGQSYDVRFGDGIFGNNVSSIFTNWSAANAASEALAAQVFTDSAQGNFDSKPALTNGCTEPTVCNTYTLYQNSGGDTYFRSVMNWNDASSLPADNYGNGSNYFTFDTHTSEWQNIATWYIAGSAPAVNNAPSAVPVPAAAWLFGSGLVGLAGLRRRKQAA